MGIKITATGHYLPSHIVTNDDLAQIMDTSDEWIQKRTGIAQRHISTGENTSDLASKVAEKILENRGIQAEELDFIILATMTPDSLAPSTACVVQDKINASKAFCFDISAACSGFIYALSMANHLMRSGGYKKGLVLGAETMSKVINWQDRSTAVLFGDGAGGVLLEASETLTESFIAEDLHSDGTRHLALVADEKGVRNPFFPEQPKDNLCLEMDGRSIFDFAIRNVPETINQVIANSNLKKEDISWVIPHQANIRLIQAISKKTKIPIEKFGMNIAKTGNTSAGSIPILLDQMIMNQTIQTGDILLLTGFGGGLTWGSITVKI
ncbi:3-oxoacyl-[acyl-carrier-protein] synthase 3 [Jeotgalibaca dankookensis]|uniref:Beta-ketoacyl-[acyl-carrier-protein] synthase III n=1 Tax=Jeotgalibaca dankookensis TaxID=708126 RepID=A0A1S6IP52_9LACT|nr:beta-ketoacyl-ACP synthase III [Jeotgalibaca dankookensis]AQS53289.1 3-oxoacyl-[acyl-carrier-protein] synthase 3 [Jeotgalibaca dankookensis]